MRIARSNHLVVLGNSVIPFFDVGIRQEPHILFGNDPARFVHCVDQSGVHPRLDWTSILRQAVKS